MDDPTEAQIETIALAIAQAKGCGVLVDGAPVLCCDPRSQYQDRKECSCWAAATAVAAGDTVTIPSAQYEALMAGAKEFLAEWGNYKRPCICAACTRRSGVLAAIRAAGIDEESK